MKLRKLIEALTQLSTQRGPDVDVKTMPVFMFDVKAGKASGICSFYVGEHTQVTPSGKRTKTVRTIILEIT